MLQTGFYGDAVAGRRKEFRRIECCFTCRGHYPLLTLKQLSALEPSGNDGASGSGLPAEKSLGAQAVGCGKRPKPQLHAAI